MIVKVYQITFLIILNVLCFDALALKKDRKTCDVLVEEIRVAVDKEILTVEDCSLECVRRLSPALGFNDPACVQLCSKKCDDFFRASAKINLSDLYPGLTKAEKKLVDSNPKMSLKAYWLSYKAENMCAKVYKDSRTNDESDACRHFIWAGLMTFELGENNSKLYLDAHENNDGEEESERAMDLANNRAGLIVSKQMIEKKNWSNENLVAEFKKALAKRELIVLSPRKVKK